LKLHHIIIQTSFTVITFAVDRSPHSWFWQ